MDMFPASMESCAYRGIKTKNIYVLNFECLGDSDGLHKRGTECSSLFANKNLHVLVLPLQTGNCNCDYCRCKDMYVIPTTA